MRVLVTRPEPGATNTASGLRELGHEPVVMPLSKVSQVELADMPDPTSFDAVALTSANALHHAPESLAASYGALLCFAVGERTGEVAADAGFTKVISADGDVGALVALVAQTLPAGARILYPCGQHRRPVLEEELAKRGNEVTALETYRTDPIEYAPADAASLLGDGPLDAALVYSRFGAVRLSALAEGSSIAARFGSTRVLCMSDQVADGLSDALHEHAEIAVSPNEDALIALLGRESPA